MRTLDLATTNALAARQLVIRHFLWITPRDLTTGLQLTPVGFWNDVGTVSLNVIDGVTGGLVGRTYNGSGTAISFDNVILSTGLVVNTTVVELNMIDVTINNLVRGNNLRKAPVERHLGLFDPSSRLVVSTLYSEFVGFVNEATITAPIVGQSGSVKLSMVSHTRELTRLGTEKRSDASQQKRNVGDRFFQYCTAAGSFQIFWGHSKDSVASGAPATAAASSTTTRFGPRGG